MKNLDLKQIGVQELSTVEKREADGGFIIFVIIAFANAFDSSVQPDGPLGGYLGSKL